MWFLCSLPSSISSHFTWTFLCSRPHYFPDWFPTSDVFMYLTIWSSCCQFTISQDLYFFVYKGQNFHYWQDSTSGLIIYHILKQPPEHFKLLWEHSLSKLLPTWPQLVYCMCHCSYYKDNSTTPKLMESYLQNYVAYAGLLLLRIVYNPWISSDRLIDSKTSSRNWMRILRIVEQKRLHLFCIYLCTLEHFCGVVVTDLEYSLVYFCSCSSTIHSPVKHLIKHCCLWKCMHWLAAKVTTLFIFRHRNIYSSVISVFISFSFSNILEKLVKTKQNRKT